MARYWGPVAQKILLLVGAGLTLGLSHNPRTHVKILEAVAHDWKEINKNHLEQTISRLYKSKLIDFKLNRNGTHTIVLTQNGRQKAITYRIESIKVQPMKRWDGKWRVVLFDVPEKSRVIRDALRRVLRRTGFFEYQKSVFVHPFDCRDEVDFIIEFFRARPYTRFIVADSLDNEFHIKSHFELS